MCEIIPLHKKEKKKKFFSRNAVLLSSVNHMHVNPKSTGEDEDHRGVHRVGLTLDLSVTLRNMQC